MSPETMLICSDLYQKSPSDCDKQHDAGVSLAVQLNACFDGNNQVQVFFGNPRCQCVREICTTCIQLVDKLKQK